MYHDNRHCHEQEEVDLFNFPFYVIYSIGFTTGDQHTTNHGTKMIKDRFLDLFCHYSIVDIITLTNSLKQLLHSMFFFIG